MDGPVAVIGAGSWGTTVATLFGRRLPVRLWARRASVAEAMATTQTNEAYLPGHRLPNRVSATADPSEALDGASLVVIAVPSHGVRSVCQDISGRIPPKVPLVSLTKGIEAGSDLRMTQVLAELLPGHPAGVLTGPNLATEVAAGQPAACVVAFENEWLARLVQAALASPTFRVYTNTDVVGCEIAGAFKNVIAIAAGVSDGLGFGDNTRATLISRALIELGRLGIALGAVPFTFAGLAGVGDLVATCTSPRSRNHYVGMELARGRSAAEIMGEMSMVAEGVRTAPSMVHLARHHGIELPIAEQVASLLAGSCDADEAISRLMTRSAKSEITGVAYDLSSGSRWRADHGGPGDYSSAADYSGPGDYGDEISPSDQSGYEDQSGAERLHQVQELILAPLARDLGAVDARHRLALSQVSEVLIARGSTPEEVREAAAGGMLSLLVAEKVAMPARERYTRADMAAGTGVAIDVLERLWRALGFTDVGDNEIAFTDVDMEAARVLDRLMNAGVTDLESGIQMARVLGASMARVAEAEVAVARSWDDDDDLLMAERLVLASDSLLPAFGRLLEYAWRRHLEAVVRRLMIQRASGAELDSAGGMEMAVGFADMVGFTVLSQQIAAEDLARVITRFEEIAYDRVTSWGGRVVKMIGDEVMFVADDAERAASVGLDLAEAYADDELLSDVRVGIAVGPVVAVDGDYYGHTVNLASRIVNLADPGAVLVDPGMHACLGDRDGFVWRSLRPRYLKDIGKVELWSLMRPGQEEQAESRRLGERWQRFSDSFMKDLEELRARGERLIQDATDRQAATKGQEAGTGGPTS